MIVARGVMVARRVFDSTEVEMCKTAKTSAKRLGSNNCWPIEYYNIGFSRCFRCIEYVAKRRFDVVGGVWSTFITLTHSDGNCVYHILI